MSENVTAIVGVDFSVRSPDLPLSLALDTGVLKLLSWLRVLPGKRYVAEAIWKTDESEVKVLAKIYLGVRAKSKMMAELKGCQRLVDAQLLSAKIIKSGVTESISWLLLEWLPDAETLGEKLSLTVESILLPSFNHDAIASEQLGDNTKRDCSPVIENHATLPKPLKIALSLLNAMHKKGLQQEDIHLDNFLFSRCCCYIIDAADINPLEYSQRDINLAIFLAQLPHIWWSLALEYYQVCSGKPLGCDQVFKLARTHRLWRAKTVSAKSQRNCTSFCVAHSFTQWRSVWREKSESLNSLFESIDAEILKGKILKNGDGITVVLIEWGGQQLVIKRYNARGVGDFLRRGLRQSRARHGWQQGHLWRVLELPTPKPLAVIERRWGPFRRGGYLITAYQPGLDLAQSFSVASPLELLVILKNLELLLRRMVDYQLSLGRLIGTIVVDSNKSLNFIDLDAASQYVEFSSWSRNFSRDLFLLEKGLSLNGDVCYLLSEVLFKIKYFLTKKK